MILVYETIFAYQHFLEVSGKPVTSSDGLHDLMLVIPVVYPFVSKKNANKPMCKL